MLYSDGCGRIKTAQPFDQVTHCSDADADRGQALLDRDRIMIVKICLAFRDPCLTTIRALSSSLASKAETAKHASGLHGGKGLPVPSCYLGECLLRGEQYAAYDHKVFSDRLRFPATHAPDDIISGEVQLTAAYHASHAVQLPKVRLL